MPLTLRSTKKAPLTVEELDTNFKDLHERVEALEKGSFALETLKNIELEGQELVFISSYGREVGRCPLPTPLLRSRGKWSSHTPYVEGDIVTHQREVFLCSKAHQSRESLKEHHANWQLLLNLEFLTQTFKGDLSSCPQEKEIEKSLSSYEIPLYEPATLPSPHLGKVGLLLDGEKPPQLIYATDQEWKAVSSC